MEYIDLFSELHRQDVMYLICGGLAVNIYGIPRMTADIDLLVDFEKHNIQKFESVLKKLSFRSVIPVPIETYVNKESREAVIRDKNLIAYSYYSSRANYMNVDVLLDVPLSFNEMWEAKTVRPLEAFSINVISLEHLIALKTYANRKQDLDDVLLLSKFIKK